MRIATLAYDRRLRARRGSSVPAAWAVALLVLVGPVGDASGAAGELQWLSQFGSSAPSSEVAQTVDAAGNVYVAGQTDGILPGQSNAGAADAFVRKYDADGNELWTRQFGSTGSDNAWGVAVDASGVYVVGRVEGALPGQPRAGSGDAFVRKYDADGNELWTHQFGTVGGETANGVAATASGIYVGGATTGAFPGQTNAGAGDVWVRKYDGGGGVLWTRQFGTPSSDSAFGIAADAAGVYVVGPTGGTLPGQTSGGGAPDAFVRRYDADGNEEWTRQFGTAGNDQAHGVAAAGASGVYVVGETASDAFVRKFDADGSDAWSRRFGTSGFDWASGVAVEGSAVYVAGGAGAALQGQVSAGVTDAFVRRYDADGNEAWTRQFGTSSYDHARGVALDAGAVYVAGSAGSALPGQSTGGRGDVFLRRYGADGTETWSRQFGGAGLAFDVAQAVDAAGAVYVAGRADGSLPGETNAGSGDAFVRKYDEAGNVAWNRQFGSTGLDQALAVLAEPTAVYVAGQTFGTLPGQSSAGGTDGFLRKYDAAGNVVWTRQLGTAGSDAAVAIASDTGAIYVAGRTTGAFTPEPSAGADDAFVQKYDAAGTLLWTRQFGTSGLDRALGVAADSSGVYVAGRTLGVFPGEAAAGGSDGFVRRYDASGTLQWTRQFGTTTIDTADAIAADDSGAYVAGRTFGVLPGQTGAGSEDAFVRKYDAAGTVLWTRQFGTSDADRTFAVAAGPSSVLVAGVTFGVFPGQAGAGGMDAFVQALDSSGNLAWTVQLGSPRPDAAAGVAADSSGIYLAGSTAGTLPGQASFGGDDAFVAKILAPANQPPVAVAGPSQAVAEGDTVTLDGSASFDPDGDPLTYEWALVAAPEGRAPALSGADTATPTFVAPDDGTYVFELTVADGMDVSGASAATVVVSNVSPAIGEIVGPTAPQLVGTTVEVRAAFTDAGDDAYTCLIEWGDGSSSSAAACDGSHAYAAAGLYTVRVTVTDDDGGSDSEEFQHVVVYDPEAGFVTGAGWIESPPGAYAADPALSGRATFAFVSRYQRGASVPEGSMRFDLQAAGLRFRSTSYQWLVVAGSDAHLKGSGTIDGTGDYEFLLTATDGDPDRLRIEIRDRATGHLVYDNGPGDDADGPTALGAGSVALHP